jgi:hypothetical protein
VIDGQCSNTGECENKSSNGGCRSGCKHSEDEITSSCIVDECNKYNVTNCPNTSGCVLFDESCIGDIESNLCINQHTIKSCLLIPNCDFFIGFICSEKVSYKGDCSAMGDDACASTKGCVWKNWSVGCADDDSDEVKEKEDNSNGGWVLGIVSLGLILILFFFWLCLSSLDLYIILFFN